MQKEIRIPVIGFNIISNPAVLIMITGQKRRESFVASVIRCTV